MTTKNHQEEFQKQLNSKSKRCTIRRSHSQKSIQESLEKSFPKTFPDIIQIYNFLAEYRKELYGEHEFDIGQLRKWCDKYSINETNTTEDDEIIVQSSISIESEDNAKFYVFVSTKRLLENCRKTEHICADATYKLTYEGFPVLLCGTTDKCKKFHPIGAALCSDETTDAFQFIFQATKDMIRHIFHYDYAPRYLVADGADSITNAFTNVYGTNYQRCMCWFHMIKCIDNS
jgi:hypothetical protein